MFALLADGSVITVITANTIDEARLILYSIWHD